MRFVSRSVITGFVNALAILIFMAQLPELTNVSWVVYAMTAAGLAIIYGLPYLTKAVPSPLVTIVVLTAVSLALGLDIRTVGDMGQLPDSLPVFLLPDVPLNWDTLPSSSRTRHAGGGGPARIDDDRLHRRRPDRHRQQQEPRVRGPGRGQHRHRLHRRHGRLRDDRPVVINVKSGGRGRLSTLVAGLFLLILVVFLGDWVARIPMAAWSR
jgi:sulfate permease, SulP family